MENVWKHLFSAMMTKANDVVFHAKKLMRHSRRRNLTPKDVENALNFYVVGQTGLEEEDKEQSVPLGFDDNPINSKVEMEWVNLFNPERVKNDSWPEGIHSDSCYEGAAIKLNSEQRYLFDWYKDKNNIENIKHDEGKDVIIPFPDIDEDNDLSKTILKYIKYKIKSESYHLLQIMSMSLKLSKQIIDYWEIMPLSSRKSSEPRASKIDEIITINNEIKAKLETFKNRGNQDVSVLEVMHEETLKWLKRCKKIKEKLR